MPPSGPIIYVCGTDTGVGKTVVLGAILAYLRGLGRMVRFFKPFESGRPRDSRFLCRMAGDGSTPATVNFFHFEAPIAPGVAARRRGLYPDLKVVTRKIQRATRTCAAVFVEGAGGLLTPLADNETNLDLIKRLGASVLVVGRLGLGTLNHTRLTYDRLRLEKIRLVGIVLCQTTAKKDLAEQTNPAVLRALGLPLLGVMPHVKRCAAKSLARALPAGIKCWLKDY